MKALHYQTQKEQNNLEERLTQEEVCQYFTSLGAGSFVRIRGKLFWLQIRHPERKSHFSSAHWPSKIYPGRTRIIEPARRLVLHSLQPNYTETITHCIVSNLTLLSISGLGISLSWLPETYYTAFPVSIKSHDFSADAVPTPKHPSGILGSISFTDTNLSEPATQQFSCVEIVGISKKKQFNVR